MSAPTHGLTRNGKLPRLYRRWAQMKNRCENPKNDRFRYYGLRGILVCERWKDYWNFHVDMVSTFKEGLTLERKDVNGPYSPENCCWADWNRQQNNKRNNRIIEFNQQRHSIADWARITGLEAGTIRSRLLKDWDAEKVLSPVLFK